MNPEKVFVETIDKHISHPSLFNAWYGFKEECETVFFERANQSKIFPQINPKESILIAGVETLKRFFSFLSIPYPKPLDYPQELVSFLGRTIEKKQFSQVKPPCFIKPYEHKVFKGFLYREFRDLIPYAFALQDKTEVWESSLVQFLAEFRVYVLKEKIQGVFFYNGDPLLQPCVKTIQEMVSLYKEAPRAYSLDVGICDGKTLLVEVNDSIALGNYGISPKIQAMMLWERWREIFNDFDF